MGDFLDKVMGFLGGSSTIPYDSWSTSDVCELKELSAKSVNVAIETLAKHDVPSDIFLLENGPDRFQAIAHCSPWRQDVLKVRLHLLSLVATNKSPEAIADKLESLYQKAYRYDPNTRLMDVIDPEAKQQLDLWIAAINHRAYQDKNFLYDIDLPRIVKVFALNSDQLTAEDRGFFHEWTSKPETLRELNEDMVTSMLQISDQYDGKAPWVESAFMQSAMQFRDAAIAHFGEAVAIGLQHKTFPINNRVEALSERGLDARYTYLESLSDNELVARSINLYELAAQKPSAPIMRQLQLESTLIAIVAIEHGKRFDDIAQQQTVSIMMERGLPREDAELLTQHGMIGYTTSRLDDYKARFKITAKFREIYTDFITTPIEDKFSQQRSARYSLWGQRILNSALTGVPIRLSDLDEIRREVHDENLSASATHGPISWWELRDTDSTEPLWLKPADLGLDDNPWSDPLAWSQEIQVGDRSLAEFAQDNVDYIAVLPQDMMPSNHALGLAYLLFGSIVISGQERHSPGSFLHTYGHEAMHLYYARANYDSAPERLSWLAANERLSYSNGVHIGEQYLQMAFPGLDERHEIEQTLSYEWLIVMAANIRLGLDPYDTAFKLSDPAWEKELPPFMYGQPAYFVGPSGQLRASSLEFVERLDPNFLDLEFTQLHVKYVHNHSSDKQTLLEGVDLLNSLAADELSPTYGETHPLGAFINELLLRTSMPQRAYITLDKNSWEQIKTQAIAYPWYLYGNVPEGGLKSWVPS